MKAKVNFPNAVILKCNTWATFSSGQICVTSTLPVACVEGPPKWDPSLTFDGPTIDKWHGGHLRKGVFVYNQEESGFVLESV